jgi:hypothetical protein
MQKYAFRVASEIPNSKLGDARAKRVPDFQVYNYATYHTPSAIGPEDNFRVADHSLSVSQCPRLGGYSGNIIDSYRLGSVTSAVSVKTVPIGI